MFLQAFIFGINVASISCGSFASFQRSAFHQVENGEMQPMLLSKIRNRKLLFYSPSWKGLGDVYTAGRQSDLEAAVWGTVARVPSTTGIKFSITQFLSARHTWNSGQRGGSVFFLGICSAN